MVFSLPSKEQIESFFAIMRAILSGAFEVLLLILAMVAVVKSHMHKNPYTSSAASQPTNTGETNKHE